MTSDGQPPVTGLEPGKPLLTHTMIQNKFKTRPCNFFQYMSLKSSTIVALDDHDPKRKTTVQKFALCESLLKGESD